MRRTGVLIGFAALITVAALLGLLHRAAFDALRAEVAELGLFGPVALALLYALLAVLLVPSLILSLTCGLFFGMGLGAATAVVGSNLGAGVGFVLARTLLRRHAEAALNRHLATAALDMALARDPFKWVLLLRLSPIFPYSLLNLMLGASGVPAGRYAAATLLGMLPATLLFVGMGSTCAACLVQPSGWTAPALAQLSGLAGMAAVTGGLVWVANLAITRRRARFVAGHDAGRSAGVLA